MDRPPAEQGRCLCRDLTVIFDFRRFSIKDKEGRFVDGCLWLAVPDTGTLRRRRRLLAREVVSSHAPRSKSERFRSSGKMNPVISKELFCSVLLITTLHPSPGQAAVATNSTPSPYPPSPVIENIVWDWKTYQ